MENQGASSDGSIKKSPSHLFIRHSNKSAPLIFRPTGWPLRWPGKESSKWRVIQFVVKQSVLSMREQFKTFKEEIFSFVLCFAGINFWAIHQSILKRYGQCFHPEKRE